MSEIQAEIQALLSWNPPRLVPTTLSGKKPSTNTRPPAIFDKHISPSLTLRYVTPLPTLIQDLAANVDRAVLAATELLPSVDDFFTAKERTKILKRVEKTITDEKGVANFYDKTTATFCTPLAPTLALHPKILTADWTGLLAWTQSASSSGYAIMDGELRIFRTANDDEVTEREKIVEAMDGETRRAFEAIRDSGLPFATWEMKSPFAGPEEVMLAIPKLRVFSWTSCNYPDCSTDHIGERQKIAAIYAGDDAINPPWKLEVSLFPTKRRDVTYYNYTMGGSFKHFRRPITCTFRREIFWNAAATGQTTRSINRGVGFHLFNGAFTATLSAHPFRGTICTCGRGIWDISAPQIPIDCSFSLHLDAATTNNTCEEKERETETGRGRGRASERQQGQTGRSRQKASYS